MKLSLFTRLMCIAFLCILISNYSIQAQSVGQQAPKLVLPDQNGQNSALDDLKGNYVYLHFWASWCKNSVEQLPTIAQIHDHYQNNNFKMYSVSMDADHQAWTNAINAFNLNWPQHHCDFSGPFSKNLQSYKSVIGTPFGFLIDPNGVILERDPNVSDHESWFSSNGLMTNSNYYTVYLGAFPNFDFIDFDYIEEEIATVESGVNEDGSYYIHLGKYENRPEAEQTLMKALNKGYYNATVITESNGGNGVGLSHVDPNTRAQQGTESSYFDYTLPQGQGSISSQESIPNIADTYYTPYAPDYTSPNNQMESTNPTTYSSNYTPYPPTKNHSNSNSQTESTNPTTTYSYTPYPPTNNYSNSNNQTRTTNPTTTYSFKNIPPNAVEESPEPQFYTSRSNKSTAEKKEFKLPEPKSYPNPTVEKPTDQDVTPSLSKLKKEQDFFNSPNPFIGRANQIEPETEATPSIYNFDNKWKTPQSKPESILDPSLQKELEQSAPPSKEQPFESSQYDFDSNSSLYNNYSTDNPEQGIYLDEIDPVANDTNYKASKYERKLKTKKKKLKRKQEKLKREMETMKEELNEIDRSIDFSSQYRDE